MRSHSIAAYRRTIQYLEGLVPTEGAAGSTVRAGGSEGQLRCLRLLKHLGNPQDHLQFIHVTGTCGKGSAVAMIHEVLHRSGIPVGSFLSPHVVTALERIRCGSRLLPQEQLVLLVNSIRPWIDAEALEGPDGAPTFYEVLFAVALTAFVRRGITVAVIEVGIGGSLDTTNVIPPPLIALITHVGLDHTQILGPDHVSIARQKAGILKPGCLAISGVTHPEAARAIQARAGELSVPLWQLGSEVVFTTRRGRVQAAFPGGELEASPGMGGAYQNINTALVLAVLGGLQKTGHSILPSALQSGIGSAFLPGRFEVLKGVDGQSIVLDIAHNPDKIGAFSEAFATRFGRHRAALIAVGRDKDLGAILARMAGLFASLVVTRPLGVKRPMVSPVELWNACQTAGISCTLRLDPWDGLKEALRLGSGVAAVTGSTYLVGEIRERFSPEARIVRSGRVGRLRGRVIIEAV